MTRREVPEAEYLEEEARASRSNRRHLIGILLVVFIFGGGAVFELVQYLVLK